MSNSPYRMTISRNILNHLGLSLYSNTPAVLTEVIANAWDADATGIFKNTEMSFNIASADMDILAEQGIVREFAGRHKAWLFAYDAYLAIRNEGAEVL